MAPGVVGGIAAHHECLSRIGSGGALIQSSAACLRGQQASEGEKQRSASTPQVVGGAPHQKGWTPQAFFQARFKDSHCVAAKPNTGPPVCNFDAIQLAPGPLADRVCAAFSFLLSGNDIRIVKIFSGSSNQPLAQAICSYIGIELGQSTIKAFPDGETFVKIEENVRGEDVFVVQSTSPPTNHHLMEMFIMIDALRRASAARITAVLPFYGYARQDRKDQPRVPITAKLVANLLVAAGVNRILTMDLHAQQIQGFFDIPVDHLYAAPVMYEYLKKKHLRDLVVVSPDVGGLKMAYAYSQVLGGALAIVAKRRKSATEVESLAVIGEIRGKDAMLVDDLTETAGTLTEAANLIKRKGARKILACVSHAILNRVGIERLRKSPIDELVTTDTVLRPAIPGVKITTLSVAGLLGEAIKRIHSNSSVTSLFEFKGGRTS
jgi:ribose-phosphate pyrophosphokinase